MRVLTFSAVIAVHAIAFTAFSSNRPAGGALMLLQFGREVFFALTAFVLVYSSRAGGERARDFWRRRFPCVALPYLAWSLIYEAARAGQAGGALSVRTVAADLLTGGAKYHLYFLLVTMQLYFVFPVLLRFLRATAFRAGTVLAAAFVANGLWLAAVHVLSAPSGLAGALFTRAYELVPTYTFCVLAGGYAAIHLPRMQAVVARRGRALLAAAAAAAAAAEGAYWLQLRWYSPRHAASVLQPAMLLTSVAAALVLYVLSSRWAAGDRRGSRLVTQASTLSFGVYLAHPLVLEVLTAHGLGNTDPIVPAPLSIVLAMVGCAAGAAVIAWTAHRTVFSFALTGRRR